MPVGVAPTYTKFVALSLNLFEPRHHFSYSQEIFIIGEPRSSSEKL